MPTYVHGWCSECGLKTDGKGGCGRGCKKMHRDQDGPIKCADTCLSDVTDGSQPNISKLMTGKDFSQWTKGFKISFKNIVANGPYGNYSLPDFGCGGALSQPGNCLEGRCAFYKYASDSLGEGCDIYLADGYVSHPDYHPSDPVGGFPLTGVDVTGAVCGTHKPKATGGFSDDDDGPLESIGGSFAMLVDRWDVTTCQSSEHPSFYVESSKSLWIPDDYCRCTNDYGYSDCRSLNYTMGVLAFNDGAVGLAPGNSWTSTYTPNNGSTTTSTHEDDFPLPWPEYTQKILIRQGEFDPFPKVYVSILFVTLPIFTASDGTIAGFEIPTSGGHGSIASIGPDMWRVTYVGNLTEQCACLSDITLDTIYSAQFVTPRENDCGTCNGAYCTANICTQEDCDGAGAEEQSDVPPPEGLCPDCWMADDWCTLPCARYYNHPSGCTRCWPVCSQLPDSSYEPYCEITDADGDGTDDTCTYYGYVQPNSQDQGGAATSPCAEATCLPNCQLERPVKNDPESFCTSGLPNKTCGSCTQSAPFVSDGSECDESVTCAYANAGERINSVYGYWQTECGTFDYSAASNYYFSGGSIEIERLD